MAKARSTVREVENNFGLSEGSLRPAGVERGKLGKTAPRFRLPNRYSLVGLGAGVLVAAVLSRWGISRYGR